MKKTRLAAMLLALLALVPAAMTACGGDDTQPSETTAASAPETEADTAPADVLDARLLVDDGVETKDFGNVPFRIVTCDGQTGYYWLEAETGEVVDDAIFRRNSKIEERFNVDIVVTVDEASASDTSRYISNAVQAGDDVIELAAIRDKYMRIEDALNDANEKGYGIVMPTLGELKLDEPSLVKQPNGYGVKVSAHADSIHMIKTGIKADLCPVIGSEEQSEEVVKFLQSEFEENPDKVWEYNMFGRSLYEMVSDGMNAKLSHMPDESREKLGETLGKIINEGSNGLICILL